MNLQIIRNPEPMLKSMNRSEYIYIDVNPNLSNFL